MSYEARRDSVDDEKEQKKQEAYAANQKAIQVGAEVASNSGWAPAKAIGTGVKIADQASGGKVSELGGKALTQANKLAPFAQGITNMAANDKLADKAYDVYNAKNSKGASAAEKAKDGAEKVKEGAENAKEGAEKVKDAQGRKELPNQMKNKQKN